MIIFTINQLIVWSVKYQKIVENVQNNNNFNS